MTRIEGIDTATAEPSIRRVFETQTERWGAPLGPYPVYARRPTVFRSVRGMWGGLDASGLLDPGLVAMVNRRVATINRCEF